MTGDGSISEASAAGFTDYGGGPGQTTGSDTSASGGSDPFDYDRFYDQYQYAGVTPDKGLAELGVSTPAYGRSGMDFNRALDALIGMQAYPYIPPEPSLNIAGIRGIPAAGMLAEDPVYGFREPITAHPVDRPTGLFDRYSQDEDAYPASVAPGSTRSLANVASATASTQPTGFLDRYSASAYDPPRAAAPNVVGTPVSGGYLVDGLGNPVTSKSYGLPGEYTPESPQLPADTLNLVDEMQRAGLLPMGPSTPSMTSATGLGYDTLEALQNAGLGSVEISPTQTVDQALAAKTANEYLTEYAPAIFGAATGFGPHLNAIRMGADVLSGKTTPGQALTGLAAGLIGAKTGIPAGVLEGIFTNNPGQIAGAGAQAGLGAIVNALTKDPVARAMADVTLGSALNRNVSKAVGGSSKKGGGLPEVLDSGLSGLSKLFSGTGTPSQRSATTDNTYSDAGNNADTYAVTSAIDKAVQEYKPPTQKREMVAGRYGPIMSYAVGA